MSEQKSGKTDSFDFLGPNLPKNGFCGRNFENLSFGFGIGFRIRIFMVYVCQFLGKTDNFEFFYLNFGKLFNIVQCFGSYNFEVVAESRVEANMSWVEVGGSVELGEGGCTI